MAAIHIPDTLDRQFDTVAQTSGESKEALVHEALLAFLEDRQDAAIAAERLKHIGGRTSLADLGKELGLGALTVLR